MAVRVHIAGEDVSRELAKSSNKVTYSTSEGGAGTSEAQINLLTPMEGLDNAPFAVEIYYEGVWRPYFTGNLVEPYDDPFTGTSEASAYGPYRWTGSNKFLESVSYEGWRSDAAIYDILRRARYRSTRIEVDVRKAIVLRGEEVRFARENSLEEAIEKILETASYSSADYPDGARVVRQRPKPAATGALVATYTEDDYPEGGFKATRGENSAGKYAYVQVFARDEAGRDRFEPVLWPVRNDGPYQPPPNSTYDIPEFSGDYNDALEAAHEMATLISDGTYACELSGVDPNPDVLPFAGIRAEEVKLTRPDAGGQEMDRTRRVFRYMAASPGEVSLEWGEAETQSASGEGVLVESKKLAKPYFVRRPARTHIRGAEFAYIGIGADGRAYVSDELPFVWQDPETYEVVVDSEIASEYGYAVYYDEDTYELVIED